jgi:hypothetical protein
MKHHMEHPRRRVDRVFLHCSASNDVALAGDGPATTF